MPAFECAIAHGVDALELDVVVTRDGVPVVHHDHALDPARTRNARGKWLTSPGLRIDTLDLEALDGFDVGRAAPDSEIARRFPEQAACDGTRIPTLEEVLSLGRRTDSRGIRFSIEIKPSPPKATAGPEVLARTVVAALREQGMIGRADILSFDWRILFEARKLAPGLGIVCLSAEQPWLATVWRKGEAAPARQCRTPRGAPVTLDRRTRHRSVRRLAAAAGEGGGKQHLGTVLS